MDKSIKFIGGALFIGLAAAVVTAIVMGKNGKFDEIIQKIKNKKDSCELEKNGIFESGFCMISKNSNDYEKNEFNDSYGEENLKTSPNGCH